MRSNSKVFIENVYFIRNVKCPHDLYYILSNVIKTYVKILPKAPFFSQIILFLRFYREGFIIWFFKQNIFVISLPPSCQSKLTILFPPFPTIFRLTFLSHFTFDHMFFSWKFKRHWSLYHNWGIIKNLCVIILNSYIYMTNCTVAA